MKQQLLDKLEEVLNSDSSIKNHVDRVYEIRTELDAGDFLTSEEKMEISSKIKSRVQEEAIKALDESKGWGAFVGATGVGKSKVAVDLSNRFVQNNSGARILIVVPTEKLRDENWRDEFYKWSKIDAWKLNVERCCYVSLNKYTDEKFDLVILDEVHCITESNSRFFNQNEVASCIALTATKPKDTIKKAILKALNINISYEISLDESVKLGLVAPYDITIVTMFLDSVDKNVKGGSKTKPFMTTEKEKYNYLSRICKTYQTKFSYLNRMRFIYNLKSKTDAAHLILNTIIPEGLRGLIFCGSIAQADTLCEHRFHSKTDDKDFHLFTQEKIDRLSCVNVLNEGHNIENLDFGFVVQLNSNERNLVQRIGRHIRFRPGHRARIIILCVVDSVDKDWVDKATANLDKTNIEVIELSRLTMGIETISFD